MNIYEERAQILEKTILCFHLYNITTLPNEIIYSIIIFLQKEYRKNLEEWLKNVKYPYDECMKSLKKVICVARPDTIIGQLYHVNHLWLRYQFVPVDFASHCTFSHKCNEEEMMCYDKRVLEKINKYK